MTAYASPTAPFASPQEADAGALLTIDLSALVKNWHTLAGEAPEAECAAVIKADAYGIGLEPAASALSDAGCTTFFVAHLCEAERFRAVNSTATLYVLNGLLPGTAAHFAAIGARPVLGSREEIADWATYCAGIGKKLPAAIHIDTGMNRLGLRLESATKLVSEAGLMEAFTPSLVMSHLVSAETPGLPINAKQIKAFEAVRALFPGVPASLCNSSGIYLPERPHYDLLRPGYALYGGNPRPGRDNPMAPVVRLAARIIQIRTVPDAETVGYSGHWTAEGRRRIATVSLGYADGFLRSLSGTNLKPGGEAVVGGVRCPIAGRISMDLITLDISGLAEDAVKRGDFATFIGDGISLDEVGTRAGSIGYEILTSLGHRFARRYKGSDRQGQDPFI
ncbi:alanine racemase [Chelatococcus asaccharovorans]|uniref:Alanine racemase n=1 Tax=Chelatococcus asaccharovorans TaxID=28210 RepID=A0A2V3U5I9_9HYPH|nr:alanine racemase [Chelatococcus asaccharovorans]MBS7703881.1 alanine racemase [Chelatococcus asaccharovorans]PXW58043.1 alanine racemase [Chelatococcus asaccharovorans]